MKGALVLLLVAEFCLAATAELIRMPKYNSTLSIGELLLRTYGFKGLTYRKYFDAVGIDPFVYGRKIVEDATLLTHELIAKYGYPAEIHRLTTDDGYILEMHRIPGSPRSPPARGKRVVYLQHGLLDSSACWILMGPHHGLGYQLADLGYDVWLGNVRGNRYSREHTQHDADGHHETRSRFWAFSWHEMGSIDLPAMIDYITAVTGQERMHYIGHSQGTTSFFVMGSQRPAYNDRIISMNALAPIAFMGNLRSPVRSAAFFQNLLNMANSVLGFFEFMPNSKLMTMLGAVACHDEAWFQFVCRNVLFLIGGFNSAQMNNTMLPVIMGHTPAGASIDQMIHYGQSIRSGRFRQFDHGRFSNFRKYRSIYPPTYNLAAVRAPVALHYSLNDWFAAPVDVQQLLLGLGNAVGKFKIADPRFNHFDFLWAIDAKRLVYPQVIEIMKRFE